MKKEQLVSALGSMTEKYEQELRRNNRTLQELLRIFRINNPKVNTVYQLREEDKTMNDVFACIGELIERSRRLFEVENNIKLEAENRELIEKLTNKTDV